jgi:hypothetical protein
VVACDALEDCVTDDNNGKGSGIGQQWTTTTMMTTAAVVVDDGR